MKCNNQYKEMCEKAKEIQKNWKPKVGDYFLLTGQYCETPGCKTCNICLSYANTFLLSGDHNETVFFFNPRLCNRDGGIVLNETSASVFVPSKEGSFELMTGMFSCTLTFQEDAVWLPTQSDLQVLCKESDFTFVSDKIHQVHDLLDEFFAYVEKTPTGIFTSFEEYWLSFYMDGAHGLAWKNGNWN